MKLIEAGLLTRVILYSFIIILLNGGLMLYVSGLIGGSPFALWRVELFLLVPFGILYILCGMGINKSTKTQEISALFKEGIISGIISSIIISIVFIGIIHFSSPGIDFYKDEVLYILYPVAVLLPYSIAMISIGGFFNNFISMQKMKKQSSFSGESPNNKSGRKVVYSTIVIIILLFCAILINIVLAEQERIFSEQSDYSCGYYHLYFSLHQDWATDKLIVVVCDENMSWSDVMVTSGNCTLPQGIISIGDEITNCSGRVRIVWEPTYQTIGTYDFNKYT